MPSTTPKLALPYPTPDETADVPRDIQALATKLDDLVYIVGELRTFALAAPPPKWVVSGQVLATADYPELSAAVGALWNVGGEAAGQFRAGPAVQGRAVVGAGAGSGLTNRPLASRFGEEAHLLSATEGSLNGNGFTQNGGAHANDMTGGLWQPRAGGVQAENFNPYNPIPGYIAIDGWTQADPNAFGIGVADTAPHTHYLSSRNADNAHNNVQPSIAVLICIYAGR